MRWTPPLALMFAACVPDAPTQPGDCRFAFGSDHKDCMLVVAVAQLQADGKAGMAFVEAEVPDSVQRDFIYLQWVKVSTDPASDSACKKVVDAEIRRQCEELARRPHLKRPDDAGAGGGPGAGGPGPRPGGGPGPGSGAGPAPGGGPPP